MKKETPKETPDDDEPGWEYIGYRPHPRRCFWCKTDGSGCSYECLIPDPADVAKDERKRMLDGDPMGEEDE